MLSILKNKENIATQILNQFDVDYDLFRQELGIVKSNDPRAEFQDENDDDFVTTFHEFDALSRGTFVIEDDREVSQAIYDGASRLIETVDQLGNRALVEYDQNSNVVRTQSIEISPSLRVSSP